MAFLAWRKPGAPRPNPKGPVSRSQTGPNGGVAGGGQSFHHATRTLADRKELSLPVLPPGRHLPCVPPPVTMKLHLSTEIGELVSFDLP